MKSNYKRNAVNGYIYWGTDFFEITFPFLSVTVVVLVLPSEVIVVFELSLVTLLCELVTITLEPLATAEDVPVVTEPLFIKEFP